MSATINNFLGVTCRMLQDKPAKSAAVVILRDSNPLPPCLVHVIVRHPENFLGLRKPDPGNLDRYPARPRSYCSIRANFTARRSKKKGIKTIRHARISKDMYRA